MEGAKKGRGNDTEGETKRRSVHMMEQYLYQHLRLSDDCAKLENHREYAPFIAAPLSKPYTGLLSIFLVRQSPSRSVLKYSVLIL